MRPTGYDNVARMFHWATVLLVLVMIPAGLIMTQDVPRELQDRLFVIHKGLGPLVFLVVRARLLWRLRHPPPPLPPDVPPGQARAAGVVHAALYAFLLLQAASGYVRVTTGGFPIEALQAIGIPPLLPKAKAVAEVASTIHAVSVSILIALITAHVAAALYHRFLRHDGVLARMWPPFVSRRS
jgi:cytochrome b561